MCGEALKVLFVASKTEAFAERPLLLGRWFDANTVQEMFCFAICRHYDYCTFIFTLFGICRRARFCHARDGACAHGKGAAGKVTLPRSFQTYCHTSPSLSSRAALWQSPELHQPCEPREKTLLAAVPQHSLLPTAPHVPEGASSAPIPVGGTACAYFHAAFILAAGLDQALQQLEHPVLLMCTGAFSSTWVI